MLGAIIGDVAGSYIEVLEIYDRSKGHRSYDERIKILDNNGILITDVDFNIKNTFERIKILDKNVPLFGERCSCTDDSILTMAIYDAIVNGNCNYEKYLRDYGLREVNEGKDIYGRSNKHTSVRLGRKCHCL